MSKSGRASGFCVVCRVGSALCALPVEHVSETMRPLAIEPLTGAPLFVSGLAVIRGVPTPVVDASRMLGLEGPGPAARFVALRIGVRRAALAVEAILGVRFLLPESLEELPPLLRDAHSDVIAAVGTLDAELLVVLNGARIVPSSVWTLLDGAGAPR